MIVRKTTEADLDAVMSVYADARDFMRENGNPNQWFHNHPPRELIIKDIRDGGSYVCCPENDEGRVLAVFYLSTKPDPTYTKISGAWLNDAPYAVIHRIARAKDAKGAGAFCLEWCHKHTKNIRIDTHKDNKPMIKLLGELGYAYCGVIWLETGDERLAYQKC